MRTIVALLLSTFAALELQAGEPRDAAVVARQIDAALEKRLAAEKTPIAGPADDAEFVRRAYLDLHGVIPQPEKVRAFLSDQSPDKRDRLIDSLLASSAYGQHFARVWYNRMVPTTIVARRIVSPLFLDWLAERFNENRGWDTFARDLILASGERDKNPATSLFLVHLGDGENPQPDPARITASFSRMFLGVRLECCQCHNHFFTDLKQTDFWGMAAFFTNIRADNVKQQSPKSTGPKLLEGVSVVLAKKSPPPISAVAVIEIPETKGTKVQAKFLNGPELPTPERPLFRPALAEWVVSSKNPYFAKAAVNRMWASFFGQGLVNPVDDMRPEFPPSHPEIFDLLTKEFIDSQFDLKYLARCLMSTKAYQRTSTPLGDIAQPELYGHMPARVMTADQLYDSLSQILNRPVGEHIANGGQKFKYGDTRERFRAFFPNGGADENTPVPDYSHGIPQVLRLLNSSNLTDPFKASTKLFPPRASADTVIENLYLSTLSRFPTPNEKKTMTAFLADEPNKEKGYRDLLWVLLNSGEFLHNH